MKAMKNRSIQPGACFLAVPTYDAQVSIGTHTAVIQALTHSSRPLRTMCIQMSLLCRGFNSLWAEALNARANSGSQGVGQGVDRFVMLHADIQPLAPDWLEHLLALLEEHDLDVLSAAVPIKAGSGEETSTASEPLDASDRALLTQTALRNLPPTFTAGAYQQDTGQRLLINTGLMAVRFDRPWVEEFCFQMQDSIVRGEDGLFYAGGTSEDWDMSRWLHAQGIPYGVTREIPLRHIGQAAYMIGGEK